MGVAERFRRQPPERLAERVSAAIYGTVLVLAAIPLVDVADVDSGAGWGLVTGVGAATWVAHLFAEVVGDGLRHGATHDLGGIRRAMADGLPILLVAVAPALMLLLGRLDVLGDRGALWAALAVGLVQLAGVGAFVGWAASRAGVRRWWSYAALTAVVGLVVVVLKLRLSH